jgi:hypothetical protein
MTTTFAQPNYLTLPPYKVNVSGTTPSISTITGAATAQYKVSNGAYDENGNLLFYIKDGSVYSATSTFIGGAFIASNQVGHSHEIAIVPVLGQCKKFYVIGFINGLSTCQLHYSTIDCTPVTPSITYNTTLSTPLLSDGEQKNGIAISKLIGTTNTRFLYTVTLNYAKKWIISSTGITLSNTVSAAGGTSNLSELELSSDGTKLIHSSSYTGQNMYVYSLDINGNFNITTPYVSYIFPSGITNVYGVEIDASNTKVYLCTNNGLYWNTIGSTTFNQISGTSTTYSNSFIESAKDGYMYVVSNTGILGRLNTSTNTVAASGITQTMQSNGYLPSLYGNPYTLPDNIDGDNYNYFFGVAAAVPAFQVNATNVSCGAATLFYNCAAITLNNNSTGATQYQLTLTPTNSSGTPTGGAIYTSAWLTTCPSDLKNLPGSNGIWLASNTGYFKLNILEKNSCNTQSAAYCIFLQIATTPGPTENLTIYGKNSTNYNPSQNIANPILVGCYSLGMSVGTGGLGTTNNITSYQYKIEEANCTTGAVLSVLYNGASVPIITSGAIPFIGFNQAVINGNQGYFGGNCNSLLGKCYKLTLTVSNPCGSATDWSYFKIDNPPYYRMASTKNEEDISFIENNFSIFPNPFKDKLTINYYLENEKKVKIQLFDYSGKEVINTTENNWSAVGNHTIEISTNDLPSGIYFYRADIDKLYLGKIIKTQ